MLTNIFHNPPTLPCIFRPLQAAIAIALNRKLTSLRRKSCTISEVIALQRFDLELRSILQLLSEPKTNSATENHSLLKHRHLQLQMAFQQSEQKSDFADKSIMSCANDALAGAASIVASAPCYEDMCSLSSDSDDKYLGDSSASETGIYTVGSPRKKAQKPPYPASSVDTDSGVKVRPPNPPTKRFQSDGRL